METNEKTNNCPRTRKIIFWFFGVLALLFLLALSDILFFPISKTKLDPVGRFEVGRINKIWADKLASVPKEQKKLVGYDDMIKSLPFPERNFARRILAIDPAELGFKGPFFSMDAADELEPLPAKTLSWQGEEIDTGINFLPRPVLSDYDRMMEAMRRDIGKDLFVESGYRSPGYQAWLFFYYLGAENGYSLSENAKWIAMPGYSEHNSPNTALDLISSEGISGQEKNQTAEDFEKLPEYEWLQAHAAEYNFRQTYPRDNGFGVNFESWHWHWEEV